MPEPGDIIRIENGSLAGEYEVTVARPIPRTTYRSALAGLRGQTNQVAFLDDQAFFPTGMSVSGRIPTTLPPAHHVRPRDAMSSMPRTVFQRRPGHVHIQADYTTSEMRLAAELSRAIDNAERLIGNDRTGDCTSHATSMGCMVPSNPDPFYVPGGAAIPFEATTVIRLHGSPRATDGNHEVTFTMQKNRDGYIPGKVSFLPIECVRQALGDTPDKVRPLKSCWQWLRSPAF